MLHEWKQRCSVYEEVHCIILIRYVVFCSNLCILLALTMLNALISTCPRVGANVTFRYLFNKRQLTVMYVWESMASPASRKCLLWSGRVRVCISGLFRALPEQRRQMNKKEWRGPLAAARRETQNTLSRTHTVGNTAPRITADARVRAQRLVCRSPGAVSTKVRVLRWGGAVEAPHTASHWHRIVVASRGAHFLVAIQLPASRRC